MRPSLIRVRDIFPIWFTLFLGLMGMTAVVLSHLNANTWGEKVSTGGWVTSIIVLVYCITIFIVFYYGRWKWISKWKYTTRHGIQCFFDDDAIPYLITDVEDATVEALAKLSTLSSPYTTLEGITCLFVASDIFKVLTPGYPMRLVYGVASGNFIKVGQVGKSIKDTAYIHECGHIYVNRSQGRDVPEDEAHRIFKTIGI